MSEEDQEEPNESTKEAQRLNWAMTMARLSEELIEELEMSIWTQDDYHDIKERAEKLDEATNNLNEHELLRSNLNRQISRVCLMLRYPWPEGGRAPILEDWEQDIAVRVLDKARRYGDRIHGAVDESGKSVKTRRDMPMGFTARVEEWDDL